MHLAHAAGLNLDQCRRDRLRCRKYTGVGDPHRAALGLDRLLRQHPVAEASGDTGVAPAILSEASGPGTGRRKCRARWDPGRGVKDEPGTPKFLDNTSFGVCLNQSLSRKVLSSSKSPSSNTSRNSQPSGLRPWIECGMPHGKYQRSPTPTSSTKLCPWGSIAVMRAVP